MAYQQPPIYPYPAYDDLRLSHLPSGPPGYISPDKTPAAVISARQTGTALPPKLLAKLETKYVFLRHFAIGLLSLTVFAAPIIYGISGWFQVQRFESEIIDDLCDKEAASAAQQNFLIDVRLGGSLTFSAAKIIDIFWDLIVGQGGRFLHAWILYRFVVADALVWTMERSAVPYDYFINLSFSTISLAALWSVAKILVRRPNFRTVLSALWMLYAIGYTLLFATFWSAATGYIAPSTRMYPMPDGTLAPINSPLLNLCWSLDGGRLGLDADHVEMGPTLESIYNYLARRDKGNRDSATREVWWYLNPESTPMVSMSDDFRNIYAYAKAFQQIQFYLNFTGATHKLYDTALTGPSLPISYNMSTDSEFGYVSDSDGPPKTPPANPPPGLPLQLSGWQYTGVSQPTSDLNLISEYLEWDITSYHATFLLDSSIAPGPSILPYNSTLYFDSRTIALPAPFLAIGKGCTAHNNYYTSMGSCVCYRGLPIATDWYNKANLVCVNKSGYAWGFSGFLVLVGLILEGIWAIGCWAIWLDAQVNSQLVKHRRRGAGSALRNALDLAESVNRDLGTNTCAYSAGELEKELDKCEAVGYSVDERVGLGHIGLESESMRQRPIISYGVYYGGNGGPA